MTSEVYNMFVRILRIRIFKSNRHRLRFDFHERFESDVFTYEKLTLFMTRSQERFEKLQDLLR